MKQQNFEMVDDTFEVAIKVMERLKLFAIAESLGGVECMCAHPASMSHASIPKEEREKVGLKDTLIRLSIGIEAIEDILLDLEQAMA